MDHPNAYDRLGKGYRDVRRADPRIAALLAAAAGPGSAVDVGAGTGSYETAGCRLAVEPSAVMTAQRGAGAAPAVRAVAEALPARDGAFDVATAFLTHHHWSDAARGFAEMRQVARRQVVPTWDPEVAATAFWFVRDPLPEVTDRERALPTPEAARRELAGRVSVVAVPHDCTDGFFAAYWRRPRACLDPAVRVGISGLALLPPVLVTRALGRLVDDLADGTWARRRAPLLGRSEAEMGHRLVCAG